MRSLRSLPLLLVAALLALPCRAQDAPPRDVASRITAVTVYLDGGARIERHATAQLPAGASTLRFPALAPHLDARSVQLDAEGRFTVLSVSPRDNFLDTSGVAVRVRPLTQRRDAVRDSVAALEALLDVARQEEAMLTANRDLGGTSGVTAEQLRAGLALYRERLTEIKQRQLALSARIEHLKAQQRAVELQMREAQSAPGLATSEVLVAVVAEQATRAEFTLTYNVSGAIWEPVYDLRVEDTQGPVSLVMRGEVQQKTGEDWRDVRLVLSTGSPAKPGEIPVLTPLRVERFFAESIPPPQEELPEVQSSAIVEEGDPNADPNEITGNASESVAYRTVPILERTTVTTTEYTITLPATVLSDGQQQTVQVRSLTTPATYEWYTAPRLEAAAFLTAHLTDWEQLDLLPGQASIFLGGAFVGRAAIDPAVTRDTLTLSLGRDPGVVVRRSEQRDVTGRDRMGTRGTRLFAYEITVRNTRRSAVPIVVEESVPLPADEKIKVERKVTEPSEYEQATGRVRWRRSLAPGATETLRLSYEVRYPRDWEIIIGE